MQYFHKDFLRRKTLKQYDWVDYVGLDIVDQEEENITFVETFLLHPFDHKVDFWIRFVSKLLSFCWIFWMFHFVSKVGHSVYLCSLNKNLSFEIEFSIQNWITIFQPQHTVTVKDFLWNCVSNGHHHGLHGHHHDHHHGRHHHHYHYHYYHHHHHPPPHHHQWWFIIITIIIMIIVITWCSSANWMGTPGS